MNWRSFFGLRPQGKDKPVEKYVDMLFDYYYGGNRKTEVTSPYQAMQLPTVYRCVDILSGTIASLPLEVKRDNGSGLFRVLDRGNLNLLFAGRANERQTFYDLMFNAVSQRYLHGNAYILPRWDGEEVTELILLQGVGYDSFRNVYTVSDATHGIYGEYPACDIIHLRNKTLDGYTGLSTIDFAARSMTLAAVADLQTLEGLNDGNRQKGFITGQSPAVGLGSISDEITDVVANRLERELSSGKSIIRMPGAFDFKPLTITPVDAQLLETRKFSPYDICRFFGVHPDMVFVEQSGNYKASENAQITYLQQTLSPVLCQISREFTTKLIPASVRKRYKIEHDTDSMFFTDSLSRAEFYKRSIESGVMTPNEVRHKEGREPVDGGDVAYISCNVAPLTSARNEPTRGESVSGKVNSELTKEQKE